MRSILFSSFLDRSGTLAEERVVAAQQHPVPARADRKLPSITIDGHALFEFSMRLNRALKRFERRFGAPEMELIPAYRKMWQQPPQNPR